MPISPLLPDELWVKIFNSFGDDYYDLPSLWMQSRSICKASKNIIENHFQQHVLPRMVIFTEGQRHDNDPKLFEISKPHTYFRNPRHHNPITNYQFDVPIYSVEVLRPWGRSYDFDRHATPRSRFTFVQNVTQECLAIRWNWREFLEWFFGDELATLASVPLLAENNHIQTPDDNKMRRQLDFRARLRIVMPRGTPSSYSATDSTEFGLSVCYYHM